jgi:hypothetical protein
MAGAGAPRGVPGERPPSGGGWRTRSCVRRHGVRGARRRRPASPSPASGAGPRPGRRERHCRRSSGADGQVRTGQRPGDGNRPSPGTGRICVSPSTVQDTGPALPHTSAPPGRVRALPEGEPAVGRGENRRASGRSAAGSAPSEASQVAAEFGRAGCGRARGPSRRFRSPGEEGNRSRRARGECGGRRPAAGCRGRATASVRRGSAYLGGGEQALTGTSSRRSPGTWHVAPARENRGPDSTAGRRVPGPVRSVHRTPRTAGASRWLGSVQGVHSVLRRGRPLLHGGPAASTAVRPGPDRGEAAPQRGKTPRAGSWGCWASPAAPRGGRPAAWEPDGPGHPRRGTRRRLRRPRGRRGGRANAAGPAGGRPPASRGSQPGREPPGGRRVEPESPRRGARPAARRPRARRAG